MKKRTLAVIASLSLFLCLGTSVHAVSLTRPQVVAKCKAAYDGLTSYEGQVKSIAVEKASTCRLTSTTHIIFLRPDYLDIEETGPVIGEFKPSFSLLSDGKSTWSNYMGRWSKQRNANAGIVSCTGTEAMTIASTLLHTSWGYPLLFHAPAPSKVTEETVDGHLTYKIPVHMRFSGKMPGDVHHYSISMDETYWIDEKTFLFVKIESVSAHFTTTEIFSTPVINGPAALSLYALPMKMPH